MTHKRSFRNLRLTKEYHYRYLGLWVMITVALMLACSGVLYLWIHEHFTGLNDITSDLHASYIELKNSIFWGLVIASVAFSTGIVALAKFTAHRIAGPYIQLERVCKAIRSGDASARLHFRDYDHLDHVAKAFNDMVDTLSARKPNA